MCGSPSTPLRFPQPQIFVALLKKNLTFNRVIRWHNFAMKSKSRIFSLVYFSSAVQPFDENQLVELLKTCRANNEKAGISGMLLFKDGNFLQVLEGEESAVKSLREKITRDPRHGQVCVLLEEFLEHRNFPDWTMGFHNLNQLNVADLSGFSNLLSSSLSAADLKNDPSLAKKLLLVFKEGNQKPQGQDR